MTTIEISLGKGVEENASEYFEKAKKMRKKIEGAKNALARYKEKLETLEKKKAKEKEQFDSIVTGAAKKEWYEKFRWFFSSEGYLVIGGRDATTNEILIKKHTVDNDVVFHTDMAGSPFFIIKTEGKQPGEQTIREVANATV